MIMVSLKKEFEMYRKLELMLFRYYKIAKYLEMCLKFNVKTQDPLDVILRPEGYDNSTNRLDCNGNGSIYIPMNPFYLNREEKKIWQQMFPYDFSNITKDHESIREHFRMVWDRINEIKNMLGYTFNSKYTPIVRESRLKVSLMKFVKTGIKEFRYNFEFAMFNNITPNEIKTFINLIKTNKKILWLC